MKILVTGATGFLGNYVIQNFLNKNISIIATSKSIENAAKKCWFNDVEYLPFDINVSRNFDGNLFEYFKKPDKIVHLSWQNLPNYNSSFHLESNLYSNYYFLKALVKGGLTDITVTGTCLEYGMQEGQLNEMLFSNPSNPYAIAKDTLRKMLQSLQTDNSFILKWLRLFYLFGHGQAATSLFSQLETALNKNEKTFNMSAGEQVRDFISVIEAADLICQISLLNQNAGLINCCSGKPQTVKQFVEDYISASGKSIKLNLGFYPYTNYEPHKFWGDRTKLNNLLNSHN